MAKRIITLIKELVQMGQKEIWINWLSVNTEKQVVDIRKMLADAGYTPDYENAPQQMFRIVHPEVVVEEVIPEVKKVIEPVVIDGMKVYTNDYGKTFYPVSGGSLTVCNYGMQLGSNNPYGLGGTWKYNSLEDGINQIKANVWIKDTEKLIIIAELVNVYDENVKQEDRVIASYKFEWCDLNNKYVETAYNVSGYQIDNGAFYSENYVMGRIDYLRKYTNVPVLFIEKV